MLFGVCVWQKDAEVEKSQTNFMVLVQNLLKNPAERKLFFKVCAAPSRREQTSWWNVSLGLQVRACVLTRPTDDFTICPPSTSQEVFPVQYGVKFDTALQALTAGLVCKMEQLLPVPNLSQVCISEIVFWHFFFYPESDNTFGFWLQRTFFYFLTIFSQIVAKIKPFNWFIRMICNCVWFFFFFLALSAWCHDLHGARCSGGMWRFDPRPKRPEDSSSPPAG